MAALDGLRAVAVVGVLLFHADVPWMPGGFLGVDVFFVLSGFLITGILLREFDRNNRINLFEFYKRRSKRLFPALWLLLVAVTIAARWAYPDAASRLRGDIPAALAYVSNWWYAWKQQSYFESTGRPAFLQHLWSLAVEEQFYLIWPVFVWLTLRRSGAWALGGLSLLLAFAVTLAMGLRARALQIPADNDPTELYFGTHTHSMGLLLGAALAVFWRRSQEGRPLHRAGNMGLTMLGLASLAVVILSFVWVTEQDPLLYRGGFLILSVAVCGVLMAASTPGCAFAAVLGTAPLRAIGRLSYGLYLWHFPIFVVTRPGLDVPIDGWRLIALRVGLTLAAAVLSYWLVERPIHERAALERFWQQLREGARPWPRLRPLQLAAALSTVAIAGITVFAFGTIAPAGDSANTIALAADVRDAIGLTNGGPTRVLITNSAGAEKDKRPVTFATVLNHEVPAAPGSLLGDGPLTALGDSVLLGVRSHLQQTISHTQVDAEIGRQAVQLIKRIKVLVAEDRLAPKVLLHFGTNGYVTEAQLRTMLDLLKDHQVIVANARAPRKWMAPNNELIARVLPEYPNAVLADWAAVSENHPEFLVSDGIHLTIRGQKAFVSEVFRAGGFPVKLPEPEVFEITTLVSGKEEFLISQPVFILSSKATAESQQMEARFRKPIALDAYWVELARCEPDGLGISQISWEAWGGLGFAPSPAAATREQQFTVANRISTQGWTRPDGTAVEPVGFSGWACAGPIGPPALVTHDPESIVARIFTASSPSSYVRDLQAMIGVAQDGVYGPRTAKIHVEALAALKPPVRIAP